MSFEIIQRIIQERPEEVSSKIFPYVEKQLNQRGEVALAGILKQIIDGSYLAPFKSQEKIFTWFSSCKKSQAIYSLSKVEVNYNHKQYDNLSKLSLFIILKAALKHISSNTDLSENRKYREYVLEFNRLLLKLYASMGVNDLPEPPLKFNDKLFMIVEGKYAESNLDVLDVLDVLCSLWDLKKLDGNIVDHKDYEELLFEIISSPVKEKLAMYRENLDTICMIQDKINDPLCFDYARIILAKFKDDEGFLQDQPNMHKFFDKFILLNAILNKHGMNNDIIYIILSYECVDKILTALEVVINLNKLNLLDNKKIQKLLYNCLLDASQKESSRLCPNFKENNFIQKEKSNFPNIHIVAQYALIDNQDEFNILDANKFDYQDFDCQDFDILVYNILKILDEDCYDFSSTFQYISDYQRRDENSICLRNSILQFIMHDKFSVEGDLKFMYDKLYKCYKSTNPEIDFTDLYAKYKSYPLNNNKLSQLYNRLRDYIDEGKPVYNRMLNLYNVCRDTYSEDSKGAVQHLQVTIALAKINEMKSKIKSLDQAKKAGLTALYNASITQAIYESDNIFEFATRDDLERFVNELNNHEEFTDIATNLKSCIRLLPKKLNEEQLLEFRKQYVVSKVYECKKAPELPTNIMDIIDQAIIPCSIYTTGKSEVFMNENNAVYNRISDMYNFYKRNLLPTATEEQYHCHLYSTIAFCKMNVSIEMLKADQAKQDAIAIYQLYFNKRVNALEYIFNEVTIEKLEIFIAKLRAVNSEKYKYIIQDFNVCLNALPHNTVEVKNYKVKSDFLDSLANRLQLTLSINDNLTEILPKRRAERRVREIFSRSSKTLTLRSAFVDNDIPTITSALLDITQHPQEDLLKTSLHMYELIYALNRDSACADKLYSELPDCIKKLHSSLQDAITYGVVERKIIQQSINRLLQQAGIEDKHYNNFLQNILCSLIEIKYNSVNAHKRIILNFVDHKETKALFSWRESLEGIKACDIVSSTEMQDIASSINSLCTVVMACKEQSPVIKDQIFGGEDIKQITFHKLQQCITQYNPSQEQSSQEQELVELMKLELYHVEKSLGLTARTSYTYPEDDHVLCDINFSDIKYKKLFLRYMLDYDRSPERYNELLKELVLIEDSVSRRTSNDCVMYYKSQLADASNLSNKRHDIIKKIFTIALEQQEINEILKQNEKHGFNAENESLSIKEIQQALKDMKQFAGNQAKEVDDLLNKSSALDNNKMSHYKKLKSIQNIIRIANELSNSLRILDIKSAYYLNKNLKIVKNSLQLFEGLLSNPPSNCYAENNTVHHLLYNAKSLLNNRVGCKDFLKKANSAQLCTLSWALNNREDNVYQFDQLRKIISLSPEWSIRYSSKVGDRFLHDLDIIGCHCNKNNVDIKKLYGDHYSVKSAASYCYAKQNNPLWVKLLQWQEDLVKDYHDIYSILFNIYDFIRRNSLARDILILLAILSFATTFLGFYIPLLFPAITGFLVTLLVLRYTEHNITDFFWRYNNNNSVFQNIVHRMVSSVFCLQPGNIVVADSSMQQVNKWEDMDPALATTGL